MAACSPVLLEPVMKVEIVTPSDATSKIIALIPQRRGQILGYDARPGWPGWDVVEATMYVAVLSIILGQALLFSSWTLVAYAVIGAVVMGSFVKFYEEPTLARRYGADYETYRRNVPGWLPRLTPWRGEQITSAADRPLGLE